MTPDQRQLRAGVWDLPATVPPRGICVLLNGMTEFLEKYEEVARELGARGFVVASLDWRSQGASERRWASNRASHVGSFEEYDTDLGALLLQAVEPLQPKERLPVIALAHSMGAHILLRFLHESPRRFACAALVAPMLEVETGRYSPRLTQSVATVLSLRAASTRLVFGSEERDPLETPFEQNVVTSDRGRFERTRSLLKAQPFLRIFGPTFGWLNAAFRSMRRIRRRGFAEAITTPLLVVGAGADRVVKTQAIRDYVKRLKNARYVEIDGTEHEILMEQDSIRDRFWTEFDAFIDAQRTSSLQPSSQAERI
jgi:lysophospholipase